MFMFVKNMGMQSLLIILIYFSQMHCMLRLFLLVCLSGVTLLSI